MVCFGEANFDSNAWNRSSSFCAIVSQDPTGGGPWPESEIGPWHPCQFAMLCNEGFSFDLGERGSFQNKSLYALKTNERKHILEIGQLKVIIDSLRK